MRAKKLNGEWSEEDDEFETDDAFEADDEFDEDDEEWEEDGEHDEDEHDEHDALIESATQLAALAESKPAAIAYLVDLLIDSNDEERAIELLSELKSSVKDTAAARVIAIRLAQLYTQADQPQQIRQLLMELCP